MEGQPVRISPRHTTTCLLTALAISVLGSFSASAATFVRSSGRDQVRTASQTVTTRSAAQTSPSIPIDSASRPVGFEQHWNLTIPVHKDPRGIDPASDFDSGDGVAPQDGTVVRPIMGGLFSVLLRFLAGL